MSNDPKQAFMNLSLPEKILSVAALAGVIAWIIAGTPWSLTWFGKLCILGMGLVVVIVATGIAGVKLFDDAQRRLALIVAGLLPITGFLLDMLRGGADVLILHACAFLMAYAVGLITGKVPGRAS